MVDASSGVERAPAEKDRALIERFVREAKAVRPPRKMKRHRPRMLKKLPGKRARTPKKPRLKLKKRLPRKRARTPKTVRRSLKHRALLSVLL